MAVISQLTLETTEAQRVIKVSIRPFPIVGIATHEAAAHQYPYLYGLAAV
mgnify:CR=1 FL=1